VNKKRGEQVLAVRASGPTARPAHASAQLIDADLDAALPSLFFLGRRDPTDPFVSRQWGDIGPEALRSGIGFYGFPDICWQFVHRAARDLLSRHTSNRACFAQRERDKPRQGVVASTLVVIRLEAVDFIALLGDGFILHHQNSRAALSGHTCARGSAHPTYYCRVDTMNRQLDCPPR
jgi:hypothetical protein